MWWRALDEPTDRPCIFYSAGKPTTIFFEIFNVFLFFFLFVSYIHSKTVECVDVLNTFWDLFLFCLNFIPLTCVCKKWNNNNNKKNHNYNKLVFYYKKNIIKLMIFGTLKSNGAFKCFSVIKFLLLMHMIHFFLCIFLWFFFLSFK